MSTAVAPSVPAKSIAELVAYAKANPGKLAFGYGLATMPHILGEVFHADDRHSTSSTCPIAAASRRRADLLGGRIHINIAPAPQLMPLIRDGKIRPLAYTGARRRARTCPDVPTMIESGFPQVGFHPDVWIGDLRAGRHAAGDRRQAQPRDQRR